MTKANQITPYPAHPSDVLTTVARVRLYDDGEPDRQYLGFNCRAADFLQLDQIANYIGELRHADDDQPAYKVSELYPLASADKPFVVAAYEVQPPLSREHAAQLGQLLIEGAFLADAARQPEGIMLIDNTGSQQPDDPMDTGRSILAQTPIRPR